MRGIAVILAAPTLHQIICASLLELTYIYAVKMAVKLTPFLLVLNLKLHLLKRFCKVIYKAHLVASYISLHIS